MMLSRPSCQLELGSARFRRAISYFDLLNLFKVSAANDGRKMSGEEIQNCNLKYIIDASEDEPDPKKVRSIERTKAMKKRVKKIKTRMAQRAADYEAKASHAAAGQGPNKAAAFDAPNKAKIGKSIREMDKLLGSQGKGSWPDSSVSTLERSLGEISRSLDKNEAKDKHAFFALKGFQTLARLFGLMADQKQSCVIPQKSIMSTSVTWKLLSIVGFVYVSSCFILESLNVTL